MSNKCFSILILKLFHSSSRTALGPLSRRQKSEASESWIWTQKEPQEMLQLNSLVTRPEPCQTGTAVLPLTHRASVPSSPSSESRDPPSLKCPASRHPALPEYTAYLWTRGWRAPHTGAEQACGLKSASQSGRALTSVASGLRPLRRKPRPLSDSPVHLRGWGVRVAPAL